MAQSKVDKYLQRRSERTGNAQQSNAQRYLEQRAQRTGVKTSLTASENGSRERKLDTAAARVQGLRNEAASGLRETVKPKEDAANESSLQESVNRFKRNYAAMEPVRGLMGSVIGKAENKARMKEMAQQIAAKPQRDARGIEMMDQNMRLDDGGEAFGSDAFRELMGVKPFVSTQEAYENRADAAFRDVTYEQRQEALEQIKAQMDKPEERNWLYDNVMAGLTGLGAAPVQSANVPAELMQDVLTDRVTAPLARMMGIDEELIKAGTGYYKTQPALGEIYHWAVDPANRAAARAQETNDMYGDMGRIGGAVIQNIPQMAYNAALAMMTGGASETTKAIDALGRAGMSFGQNVMLNAKQMATSPNFVSSFMQMFGQRYEQAAEDGADPYTATITATITTLMNAAVESGSGVEELPFTRATVGEWVKSALSEGGEEVVQQVIDQLGEKAFVDGSIPWFSAEDQRAVINPAVLGENALVGALAGGLVSGPGMAINAMTGAEVQEDTAFPEGAAPKMSDAAMELLQEAEKLNMSEGGKYPRLEIPQSDLQAMQRITDEMDAEQDGQALSGAEELKAPVYEPYTEEEAARLRVQPQEGAKEAPVYQPYAREAAVSEPTADEAKVREIAAQYGEDARVFEAHYQGGDAEEYRRGFGALYTAGKLGLGIEQVMQSASESVRGMSEAQKVSIWQAGANSVRNRITAGVVKQYTRKLDHTQRTQLRILEELGKKYNLEFDVVDSVGGGVQGAYRPGGRRIVVALDAMENAYVQAGAHEMVHYIKSTDKDAYHVLEGVVLEHLRTSEGFDLEGEIGKRLEQYRRAGQAASRADALEEIVAEAVPAVFSDEQSVRYLVRQNRSLAEKIRDFITEFAAKLKEIVQKYAAGQRREEIKALLGKEEALLEIAAVFDAALESASEVETIDSGVIEAVENDQPIDGENEIKWSLARDEEFQINAEKLNKSTGNVDAETMRKAEEARSKTRDFMRENGEIMHLPADIEGDTFFRDGAYGGSEESTSVCIRSMAVQALMDAVAKDLGRPLTVEDTLVISQDVAGYTDKPECYYCYVAQDRRAIRDFLGRYLDEREDVLGAYRKGGDKEIIRKKWLGGRKDTKNTKDRFAMWTNAVDNGIELIAPSDLASIEDLNAEITRLQERIAAKIEGRVTFAGLGYKVDGSRTKGFAGVLKGADAQLKADIHRYMQLADALSYAKSASWAKKMTGYAAYNGHILKWDSKRVQDLNDHYGLRMYSFSDFSPAFALENMQMLTDAAVKGLKVLAYTKEMEFAEIFAGTGANINISTFATEVNGQITADGMMGADWARAIKLREKYPNVGITFVETSDKLAAWAEQQEWIDTIIPYHLVRTGTKVAKYFGYKNYTAESSDKKKKGVKFKKGDVTSIPPEMHQNDIVKYVRALEEHNLTPRFEDRMRGYREFIAGEIGEDEFRAMNPYYMKYVNETRCSADETTPVQPIFDADAAIDAMKQMIKEGGYGAPIGQSYEVMQEIAEEIADKIRGGASEKAAQRIDEAKVKFSLGVSFEDQLRQLKDGTFPRNDHLYVMDTPQVLQNVGMQALPMLMTQRHAKTVMKTSGSDKHANYHGLTMSLMKKLPDAIAEPALVLCAHGYSDRVVVITDMKDQAGNTVIVPVEMGVKGYWQSVEIDANLIATAYGKEKIKELLIRAVQNNEILYADKKKSDRLGQIVGLQLPKNLTSGRYNGSIAGNAPNVNGQTKLSLSAADEAGRQILSGEVVPEDVDVDDASIRQLAEDAMKHKIGERLSEKLEPKIGNAAAKIIRDTESRYGKAKLAQKIREMIGQYAEGKADRAALKELCREIIDKSAKMDVSHREGYEETRRRLKEGGISLTEAQKQAAADEYGSYNDFRRSVFGSVKISEGATSLDRVWQELSEAHPEMFPADTGEAEMVAKLVEFTEVMQPRYVNPSGMDTEAAAQELALRLEGDVIGLLGAKNAAQKKYASAKKIEEAYRKKYNEQLAEQKKERVAEFQRIAKEMKAAKESGDGEAQKRILSEYRAANKREMLGTAYKEASAVRRAAVAVQKEKTETERLTGRVLKRASDLLKMLQKPDKGRMVPTVLQEPVIEVLEMLDINGKNAAQKGRETRAAQRFRERMENIRDFYQAVWDKQSAGDTPDELAGMMMTLSERNVEDIREAVEAFRAAGGSTTIREMSSAQLKQLEVLLKTVKHTVDSVGRLWRVQRYRSVVELGDASIEEMSAGKRRFTDDQLAGKARDFAALEMLEPVSFGERLGEGGKAIMQGLLDGEKEKFAKVREAAEATERMMKDAGVSGYDIGKWKKHVHTVRLDSGRVVKMTDAQIMNLYLAARRPQAMRHLLGGGMTLPDNKLTGNGASDLRLTQADIDRMGSLLTDKQREMAHGMQRFLANDAAKWGNDVTQRLYLYDAFNESEYWTISSDPSAVKTPEPEGERAFNAIINAGFTKPTDDKANNAIVIGDAFDVFTRHIGEMASYAGYAEILTDTMAWINYKQRGDDGLITTSVKAKIRDLLGSGGIRYITNLVQDINQARRGGDNLQITNALLGNAKRAAVMGKIRVAIQQPTSIMRAAAEINPIYLLRGLKPSKGAVKEMQKWSTLAWWKAHGNYDIGIGASMDEMLWGNMSRLKTAGDIAVRVGELGLDPGMMDDLTWAAMWNAVKREISRTRGDLEYGSDEYFRAVAVRFEYICDRTQVVDTVMHRSQIMRGKDGLVKDMTAFMSEPTKGYNMMMRAIMDVGRKPKDKKAYARLARTAAAYTAGAMMTAAMTALHDAIKYRDDEEEVWTYLTEGGFGEDWAEQWLKGFASNINPLENIVLVGDVYDMVTGGEAPGYMAMESIADVVSAFEVVANYFSGNTGARTTYGVIKPVAQAISTLTGMPINGILANAETIGRIFDPKWMQTKSSMYTAKLTYEGLYKAIVSGNKDEEASIRKQLREGMYGKLPKSLKEISTGLSDVLAMEDERVLEAFALRKAGNRTKDLVTLRKAIRAGGFTEDEVNRAINTVESKYQSMYKALLEEGKSEEAAALKVKGEKYGIDFAAVETAAKDLDEKLKAKSYEYKHLYAAIRNGSIEDIGIVAEIMESESSAKDPAKSIKSEVVGEFKAEYVGYIKSGNVYAARQLARKLAVFGIDGEDLAKWVKDSDK